MPCPADCGCDRVKPLRRPQGGKWRSFARCRSHGAHEAPPRLETHLPEQFPEEPLHVAIFPESREIGLYDVILLQVFFLNGKIDWRLDMGKISPDKAQKRNGKGNGDDKIRGIRD